ncbi:hypothetical protein J437_LFUL013928 [Ladona fulva]|uniref:PiggyBac transposable element-derived protein domain-containing protein n=1 Tax=Ladona fulva TaxID=123851 RepID=A0A8K0KFN6_LADFU|nr:hypothetical protein J437_LFUL013928 [Ladona fulva]
MLQGTSAISYTHQVVQTLMAGLLDEGRTLYTDNHYSSVMLAEDLLKNKTYVFGTLQQNRRGNPQDVCMKKLKKEEVFSMENSSGVRVMKWQDKRPILMIASNPDIKDTVVSLRKRGIEQEVKHVLEYIKAKKGVDVSDQKMAYYTTLRRSMKWYKKVAIEILLGTCIVNSWVIFNNFGARRKMSIFHTFSTPVVPSRIRQY